MEDSPKSQQQLIEELARLRQQVTHLEAECLLLRRVNQQTLPDSEIKFATLAETTSAAIFLVQDAKIYYVNHATEAFTGYSRADLLGMNFWEMVHPEFHTLVKERGLARLRGEAVPSQYEIKILTKNGEARWVDFIGRLIEFQGKPAILGTAFDITNRKQVEQERERLLAAEREQRLLAQTLREVCLALAAQTNPNAVLDEILRQAQRLVPYSTANISLLEDDCLRIVRWQGYQPFGFEELVANFVQHLTEFPLIAKAIQARQPLLIFDTQETPGWVTLENLAWIKSYIGVPICSQQRVLGILQIDGHVSHQFSVEDVARLQPLVYAAAIALENARLYEQARQELSARRQVEAEIVQRNAELLTLQFAGATLASSLDLSFILTTFTAEMINLLGAQGCIIWEWDPAANIITVMAKRGLPHYLDKMNFSPYSLTKLPLARQVLHERRAQQISLNQTSKMPYLQDISEGWLLRLPMESQGDVVGLIEIIDDRVERIFNPGEIALAQMLANQAAGALQNAHLYSQVNRRLKQQIALQAATVAISSTLDLDTVLRYIAEQMGQAIEATSAYICSYDAVTMTSTVLAEYLSPQASAREQISDLGVTYQLPRDFSTAFDHLQAGQPEEIHRHNASNGTGHDHMHQFGAKTILNIPLQLGGQTIAFAELWESRRKRQFTPEEITLCQGIAQQAAIALEHARLYRQAQQEIEERLRVEAELRQSETRQRALLNAIPDAMFRVTQAGEFKDYHQGSQPDPIWPLQAQPGQTLAELLPVDMAELALKYIDECLISGLPQVFEFRWRLPHHFQDYEIRLVVSGPYEVLGIVRNITERKQMEKQAIQSEQLATLGRLSAALTHEINNPLQSIRTHLDLMLDFALEPGEDKKFLRIMRKEVERLNEITRRILNLARPWPVARHRVVVTDLLHDVLILTQRQLKQQQIHLTTKWREAAPVLAAPGQLTQVFLNLTLNAIEATPPQGRFRVAVEAGPNQVFITFTNSGPPIPLNILSYIFEPFFTTKPGGSGLGLWVSDTLVRQHGGSITVKNLKNNQGVIFTITLPALSIMEAHR